MKTKPPVIRAEIRVDIWVSKGRIAVVYRRGGYLIADHYQNHQVDLRRVHALLQAQFLALWVSASVTKRIGLGYHEYRLVRTVLSFSWPASRLLGSKGRHVHYDEEEEG